MKSFLRLGFILAAVLCLADLDQLGAAQGRGGGKGGGGRGGGGGGGGGGRGGGGGGGGTPAGQQGQLGGGGAGGGGGTQPGGVQNPTGTESLTFKDLSANESFYFANDVTNAYLWIKLAPGKASNTVNAAVTAIVDGVQVKRQ